MVWQVWKTLIQEIDEDLGDHLSVSVHTIAANAGTAHMKYDKNSDKIIILKFISAGSGAAVSAEEARNSVDYQVPVGKKFVFIAVLTASTATNHTMRIQSSVNADTDDGTTLYTQSQQINSSDNVTTPILEVAASQYLTLVETASAGGNAQISGIIGYETDA